MDLDDGERYAAAALFTLALHITQVETGLDEVGNKLGKFKAAWGCPDEELFDDLICIPENESWPGMEVPSGFWGFDCCAPQGLCRRVYQALGIVETRWPGLLKMPEVHDAACAHDAQVALVALVRRYGALLDPAGAQLINRTTSANWAEGAASSRLGAEKQQQQQQQQQQLAGEQSGDAGVDAGAGADGEDRTASEIPGVDTTTAQAIAGFDSGTAPTAPAPAAMAKQQAENGEAEAKGEVAAAVVGRDEGATGGDTQDGVGAGDDRPADPSGPNPRTAARGSGGDEGGEAGAGEGVDAVMAGEDVMKEAPKSEPRPLVGAAAVMEGEQPVGQQEGIEPASASASRQDEYVVQTGAPEAREAWAQGEVEARREGHQDPEGSSGSADIAASAGADGRSSVSGTSGACSTTAACAAAASALRRNEPTHISVLALYELIGACLRAATAAIPEAQPLAAAVSDAGAPADAGTSSDAAIAAAAVESSSSPDARQQRDGKAAASRSSRSGGDSTFSFFRKSFRSASSKRREESSGGEVSEAGAGGRPSASAVLRVVVRRPLIRWYDARARVALRRFCHWLHIPAAKMHAMEQMWALQTLRLQTAGEFDFGGPGAADRSSARYSTYLKISAGALGGAALLALTGGLAAPAIAAGLGGAVMALHGGAAAATAVSSFGVTAAGTAAITSTFGVIGASHAGSKAAALYGDLKEFGFWSISSPVLLPPMPSVIDSLPDGDGGGGGFDTGPVPEAPLPGPLLQGSPAGDGDALQVAPPRMSFTSVTSSIAAGRRWSLFRRRVKDSQGEAGTAEAASVASTGAADGSQEDGSPLQDLGGLQQAGRQREEARQGPGREAGAPGEQAVAAAVESAKPCCSPPAAGSTHLARFASELAAAEAAPASPSPPSAGVPPTACEATVSTLQPDIEAQPQDATLPWAHACTQQAPDQQAPDQQTPDQQTPDQQAPDQQASDQQAPDQQAPDQQASDQQAPDQQAPDQQASDQQAPDQQAPDQRAPDQQAPDQQAPDQQAPDQQAPDQQAPDQQAPDQQAPAGSQVLAQEGLFVPAQLPMAGPEGNPGCSGGGSLGGGICGGGSGGGGDRAVLTYPADLSSQVSAVPLPSTDTNASPQLVAPTPTSAPVPAPTPTSAPVPAPGTGVLKSQVPAPPVAPRVNTVFREIEELDEQEARTAVAAATQPGGTENVSEQQQQQPGNAVAPVVTTASTTAAPAATTFGAAGAVEGPAGGSAAIANAAVAVTAAAAASPTTGLKSHRFDFGEDDDDAASTLDSDLWAADLDRTATARARASASVSVADSVDGAYVQALLAELDAEAADLDGGGVGGSFSTRSTMIGGGSTAPMGHGNRARGMSLGGAELPQRERSSWFWTRSMRGPAAASTAAAVEGTARAAEGGGSGPAGNAASLQPLLPVPVNPRRMGDATLAITIAINGWIKESDDFVGPWRQLPSSGRELWALVWESEVLKSLGGALRRFIRDKAIEESSKMAVRVGLSAALVTAMMPTMAVVSAINLTIGSRWRVGLRRAQLAGRCLAHMLMQGAHGDRPVTLIGFSMGARLIFHCLLELSRCGARGVVESAVLLGTPVSANERRWMQARVAVSGRLVNAFSANDWVLGVIFRAHSKNAVVQAAAGMAPVAVPGVENINLSSLIAGHTQYLEKLEDVLSALNLSEH